jgi:hypothetical protein
MTNSTLNLQSPSPAANDNDTSESNDKRCHKALKCYAPPLNSLRQARYQLPVISGRRALAQPKNVKSHSEFMQSHLFQNLKQKTVTMRRMTTILHSLSLTVPVQSELMPFMETCSIPQEILIQ